MAAKEEVVVQAVLLEVRNRLLMPSLEVCQEGDVELNFSSGFLARSWPGHVIHDINIAKLMLQCSDFAIPLTATASHEMLIPESRQQFQSKAQVPKLEGVPRSLEKHSKR